MQRGYTDHVANASDRDRLGLCLTYRRQSVGRVKGQNLSGFVFGNWITRYLWLETLGGVIERIFATERGKTIIAQRFTRLDRDSGSSEVWAYGSSAMGGMC